MSDCAMTKFYVKPLCNRIEEFTDWTFQMVDIWKDSKKGSKKKIDRFLENIDIKEAGKDARKDGAANDVICSAHINLRLVNEKR